MRGFAVVMLAAVAGCHHTPPVSMFMAMQLAEGDILQRHLRTGRW